MYTTTKKKLLIDVFKNNKDKQFTAVALTSTLSDEMNKATVYRQLQSLEKENIIRKTFNSELDVYEYQYSDNCDNHFHLKCNKCGKIVHLECKEASGFLSHILIDHGFKIDQSSSTIYGLCRGCK